ncbi:hypothetical protein EVAR_24217_1 [Eumeta japonica]|uniref:Uncharacterized protein n=1 Tax=Eumeta variegata TaxID=151549 RepID=A0A4C1W776_EUMVA|nr:hypothetical protein EVAR_24217_1 [Eumeta japonica]
MSSLKTNACPRPPLEVFYGGCRLSSRIGKCSPGRQTPTHIFLQFENAPLARRRPINPLSINEAGARPLPTNLRARLYKTFVASHLNAGANCHNAQIAGACAGVALHGVTQTVGVNRPLVSERDRVPRLIHDPGGRERQRGAPAPPAPPVAAYSGRTGNALKRDTSADTPHLTRRHRHRMFMYNKTQRVPVDHYRCAILERATRTRTYLMKRTSGGGRARRGLARINLAVPAVRALIAFGLGFYLPICRECRRFKCKSDDNGRPPKPPL